MHVFSPASVQQSTSLKQVDYCLKKETGKKAAWKNVVVPLARWKDVAPMRSREELNDRGGKVLLLTTWCIYFPHFSFCLSSKPALNGANTACHNSNGFKMANSTSIFASSTVKVFLPEHSRIVEQAYINVHFVDFSSMPSNISANIQKPPAFQKLYTTVYGYWLICYDVQV